MNRGFSLGLLKVAYLNELPAFDLARLTSMYAGTMEQFLVKQSAPDRVSD